MQRKECCFARKGHKYIYYNMLICNEMTPEGFLSGMKHKTHLPAFAALYTCTNNEKWDNEEVTRGSGVV